MEPWRAKLEAGEHQAAWDLFIDRHRALILATIRRTVGNSDDVADAFAETCAALAANDLERLKRHTESGKARFSTWLVTVVHHLTIDWLRRSEGRRRIVPPSGLSPIQQQIFQHVFVEQRTHSETYEMLRARTLSTLPFGAFLREVAATYRLVEHARGKAAVRYHGGRPPLAVHAEATAEDAVIAAELSRRLADALDGLPADVRVAVQLFVIDELPADQVARVVGWPNSKAVYNRVYRALATLRVELEQQRIGRSDL